MTTTPLYLDDTYRFEDSARVVNISYDEIGPTIILDQTIFYPQGGGQPSDIGVISSGTVKFQVQKVLRREDETIVHHGVFLEGTFEPGDEVTLSIDKERRILNARNHTAGHLLTFAAEQRYPSLSGVKGHHFPDGAYVEFEGVLEGEDKTAMAETLAKAVQDTIDQALPIEIRLVNTNELARLCKHMLSNVPPGERTRAMIVDGKALACGGTHLVNTKEVGTFTIRKIKEEKGRVKISYALS